MSPMNNSALPSRPKFSWDVKNVPWTDGKGNQEDYKDSVKLWSAFHDKLPVANANKIPDELRGIMLQSQLYGRAKDLCKKLSDVTIQSKGGSDAIVNAVCKRDALSAVSDVYRDYMALLNLKRGSNEMFKNFESRFEAQVSKFNAHSTVTKIPEALTALLLLANSNVDDSQRISVLAAASPGSGENDSTMDTYLQAIKYESIASVLRQCDQTGQQSGSASGSALHAGSAATTGRGQCPKRGKRRLTPQELADLKRRSTCRECKKKGHWAQDHNPDGSLKPGTLVIDDDDDKQKSSKHDKKPTVTFNMAQLTDHPKNFIDGDFIGPLVDDGAPYSGIGEAEFKVLQPLILPKWSGSYAELPECIADRPYWQYGKGKHSSPPRRILGSVMISARTDGNEIVEINHLIISGSSQWVIGRNVTRACDIVHIGGNRLNLPSADGGTENADTISLVDSDMHSYMPYDIFLRCANASSEIVGSRLYCATATIGSSRDSPSWKDVQKIVDKVHKHVCGHSSFSDIKTLLSRNDLWSDEVGKYLARILEGCARCAKTSEPKEQRKVSLSSMSRSFNKVVCVDHLHLGGSRVLHIMDSSTRYSAGTVVFTTSMQEAILGIEAQWVSPFWHPHTVLFDKAFDNQEFRSYLKMSVIEPRPIPPRRHNKNVLESKHKIIRDIFLRLLGDEDISDDNVNGPVLVQMALRISNDLYGNDITSANELPKGYTRPIQPGKFPKEIPSEIRSAREKLMAKRKLTLIMRSKATSDAEVQTGDLVQVYIKNQNEKRGSWTAPKPILAFDHKSQTVKVPGSKGRTIEAAVEDVRHAVTDDHLAVAVQDAIDQLAFNLDAVIDEQESDTDDNANDNGTVSAELEVQNSTDERMTQPTVGDKVSVFWPEDEKYYSGSISKVSDGDPAKYHVSYDDGDREVLDLNSEVWKFDTPDSITTNAIELTSNSQADLDKFFDFLEQKTS